MPIFLKDAEEFFKTHKRKDPKCSLCGNEITEYHIDDNNLKRAKDGSLLCDDCYFEQKYNEYVLKGKITLRIL